MSLESLLTKKTGEPLPSTPSSSPSVRSFSARDKFSIWGLPLALLLGFGVLFVVVLWPYYRSARSLEIVRALPVFEEPTLSASASSEGEKGESATQEMQETPSVSLFQAAGWLEPNPLPSRASSLVSGTVAKTYVTEGDLVKKGQMLAELDTRDFRFAQEQAQAQLAQARADKNLRQAEFKTAQSDLAMEEATLWAAEARLVSLKDTATRYEKLGAPIVSEQAVISSRQDLKEQEARVKVAERKKESMQSAVVEAEARFAAAEAAEQHAEVQVRQKESDLERTRILSPIEGRVLSMLAMTGSRLNVDSDQVDASTLALLYDPKEMCLRIDVPIEQAGKIQIGQPVKVTCSMAPDKVYEGKLVRIAGQADIQRNALQARVRLEAPDDALRPNMPSRAEVFSLPQKVSVKNSLRLGAGATSSSSGAGALVPEKALLTPPVAGKASVWVVSQAGTLEKREILVSPVGQKEGYVVVESGILPGEPVVVSPVLDLEEGELVKAAQ